MTKRVVTWYNQEDVKGLAKGILDLLQAPDRAREMGLAGRAAVHPEYASETLMANVEKLYLELLACTATVVEE